MYKSLRKLLVLIFICSNINNVFGQVEEIQLTFDTSGYGNTSGGEIGLKNSQFQNVGVAFDTLPSINGEMKVNGMGGLNYIIPIDVVPGVNNFSPNISLVYDNGARNTVAGYGWNINGLSIISVGSKTKDIEGATIGSQYDGKDPFYLDGGRLLSTDGKNFTTLLYSTIKIEKVNTNDASFEVKYPNGKVSKYKEIIPGLHMISSMSDSFGNRVNYNYEVIDGSVYLKIISYGGTATSLDKYFVNFEYADRKSKGGTFLNGNIVIQHKVLKNIIVQSPEDKNKIFRKYILTHDYIHENTLERLIQVDVENEAGEKLPPLKFVYTASNNKSIIEKSSERLRYPTNIKNFENAVVGDFNGDGNLSPVFEAVFPKLDGVSYTSRDRNLKLLMNGSEVIDNYNRSRKLYVGKILLNENQHGDKKGVISDRDILITLNTSYDDKVVDLFTFDFYDLSSRRNGGLIRTIKFSLPGIEKEGEFNSFMNMYITKDEEYPYGNILKKTTKDKSSRKIMMGDYNNDGLIDMMVFQPAGLNTPQGFYFLEVGKSAGELSNGVFAAEKIISVDSNVIFKDKTNVYPIEFDGDGIPEFLTVDQEGNINLFKFDPIAFKIKKISDLGLTKIKDFSEKTPLIFGDFNGDGLTDFMTPATLYDLKNSNLKKEIEKMESDTLYWWIYTSTGKGFRILRKDFTNQKLAYIIPSQADTYGKVSDWQKFWSGKRGDYEYSEYGSSNIIAADVNGDGKTDLVSFRKFGKIKLEEDLYRSAIDTNYKVATTFEDGMQFHIVKLNSSGFFDLNTLPSKIDLKNTAISPISIIYNKEANNGLDVYKSSVVIHDQLTNISTSYIIDNDNFVEGQLKEVSNGSGAVQKVEYMPMVAPPYRRSSSSRVPRSDSSLSVSASSSDRVVVPGGPDREVFPVEEWEGIYSYKALDLAFPYYVNKHNSTHYLVSKVHTHFDGKIISKDYLYENGIQHLGGKGFLGFQKTRVSDPYESAFESGKYSVKDINKPIFWKTFIYDPILDNSLIKETYGSFDEKQIFSSKELKHNRYLKGSYSYLILKTEEHTHDLLNGYDVSTYNSYTIDLLLEKVKTQSLNAGSSEEKYSYLPATNNGNNYFNGKIGKVETTLTRSGDTFSTKEEYTYTPNGEVATLKKYGNKTGALTTTYSYYTFGGIKEEKLSTINSIYNLGDRFDDILLTPKEPEISVHNNGFLPPINGGGVYVPPSSSIEFITKYEYDSTNRFIVKTISPNELISTSNIDAFGKIISQKDGLGRTTSFKYDSWGNAHTIIDYLGNVVKTKKSKSKVEGARYDVTVIGADGSRKIESYDVLDRVIQSKVNTLGSSRINIGDSIVFVPKPGDIVVSNPGGISPSRPDIIRDKWIVTRQEYNIYGNVVRSSQPFFDNEPPKWNNYIYDNFNRLTEVIDFKGKSIKTCYEKNKVTVVDGNKITAKWVDAQGMVTQSQDKGGVIKYTYYPNGSLKESDYEGIKTKIKIDGWGNKIELVDPSAGTYLYQYDNLSRLLKTTNPQGGTTSYSYNKQGQLMSEKTISSVEDTNIDIKYAYDETSKLPLSISGTYNDNSFSYSTVYDQYYRIKEKKEDTPAFNYINKYEFDALGRIEKTDLITTIKNSSITTKSTVKNQYNNGILDRQVDENNVLIWRLNSLTAFGESKEITFGNGQKIINTFNDNEFLQNINHSKNNKAIVDIDYVFDSNKGILLQRNNKVFNKFEQYSYDGFDRLLTETTNGVLTNEYTYDFRGRTTSNTEVGKYNYNNTDYRLQSVNLSDKGNVALQNRGFATVHYNAFKLPNEIFLKDKGRINYEFSILKNRYVAYFGSTETKDKQPIKKYYSSDKAVEIVIEKDQTKIITYITGDPYSANYIKIDSFKGNSLKSSKKFYLHRDNQATIIGITDSEGSAVEQRYFDAWGNLKAAKVGGIDKAVNKLGWVPELIIDRGYTGHEHLYTIGLIHMNGRVYDPLLRRFMSPDNYVQDVYNTQNYNRYGYVLNNPLLYTDPSGEFLLTSALIGAGIAILTNGIMNSMNDVPFFYGTGKSATIGAVSGAISAGIGSITSNMIIQAGMHGVVGGAISEIQGGKFIHGFYAGVVSSLVSSAITSFSTDVNGNLTKFGKSSYYEAVVLASGGLSGGISSSIAGGDFWSGVRQGLITSGLNHLAHQVLPGEQDPPKKSYDEMTPGERDHAYMQSLIPLNEFLLDVIEVFQGVKGVFSLGNLVKNGLSKASSVVTSSNAAKEGIQLTKKTFGHTFTTHGDDMTNFLIKRASGSGMVQGQFLNNQKAAQFILENVDKTAKGAVNIPIPKGFPARVIMPDGTFKTATHIRLVPSGGGVKTAYPLIP